MSEPRWCPDNIPKDALAWEFIRAPGPGGQHVNKTASAVQLKFYPDKLPNLSAAQRLRLAARAGRRLNRDGSILIIAHRHRSQEANRRDALERVVELLNQADRAPVARIKTKPTRAARERRLVGKKTTAQRKALRRPPSGD